MKLSQFLSTIKNEGIARRVLVMNSFDGALTVLGIVIAMYISGVRNEDIIISSSLGAAIALGISGIWSAYSVERAERTRSLKELEKHLLANLEETIIEKKLNRATIMITLVNGLSPFLTSVIIILPFFLSSMGIISVGMSFFLSIFLNAMTLFLLGVFVGRIAGECGIRNGLKMLLAGIVVGILLYILENLKGM